MTPPTYTRAHGLSQQQLDAIGHILVGASDSETSKKIGVARETITRWRLYDDTFRAALDRHRREIWDGTLDTVRASLPQAARTLHHELHVGRNRGRLALDFLTRAGLMGKPYSGALGAVSEPDTDEAAARAAEEDQSQIVTQSHDETGAPA